MAANYPTTSLQPGARGEAVKQLQDYLVSLGYLTQAQVNTGYGIYGPQTKAGVAAFQRDKGINTASVENGKSVDYAGYWGPKTLSYIQTNQGSSSQPSAPVDGKSDPAQPLTDAEYDAGVATNPGNAARIAAGNTPEMLAHAAATGDLSGLVDEYGKPFSLEAQQEALKQGMEDNRLYYEALQANEKGNVERELAQKQADYQDYLLSSGEQFQKDKTALDQSAADTGMLFSTARNQKEKKLQTSYEREQASKLGEFGRNIANKAQNYQYQYGNDAAGGLSQYYNLGQNTFNPSVATGGVSAGGLSSVYSPNQFNFQGTKNVERKAEANKRAAGYLANKGNKLLSTSYNTQL